MDQAHKQTDKIIQQEQIKSKKLYQSAYKGIREQFIQEYSKINLNENMTSEQKIQEAMKYGRLEKLTEMIASNIAETNKNAIKSVNGSNAEIYKINYNGIADMLKEYGINVGTETKTESKQELKDNPNPYNEVAIDTMTDKKQVSKKVSNTILDSIMALSSGYSAMVALKQVYESNLSSTNIITNTQATRVENIARYNAGWTSKSQKYVVIGVWNTQEDDKVREAHARANGQEAEIGKPFYVGGEQLMFPGDIAGSVGNIINCRCYLTFTIKKLTN